jgi:hypothetical protein
MAHSTRIPGTTHRQPKCAVDEDRLRSLLAVALQQVDAPENCAVAVEGSIAEGFGNDRSDLDFVLIDDSERKFPTMPTILFLDERRVEVRIRSARDMRRQAEEVFRLAETGRRGVAKIEEEMLDRCQRFSRSVPLRNRGLIESVRAAVPETKLAGVISAWFAELARDAARWAAAMRSLRRPLEAVGWARAALTYGAKSWLAHQGETYIAKKWLSEQLARVEGHDDLRARILRLESPAHAGLTPDAFVAEVADLLATLGVDGCPADPMRISLLRRRDVTTWQLGSRVHVVRQKKDVFALSAEATRVWRSLEFKTPLPRALEPIDDGSGRAGELIAEFHRLGLIGFAWRGDGEMRGRKQGTLAPTAASPMLSIDGAVLPDEATPVTLVGVSAARFAAAGMEFAFINQNIENAREDALGALKAGQYRVFERAVHRMLRHTCIAALSASGMHPVPPQEEVHARVLHLPIFSESLKAKILDLDGILRVEDAAAAEATLATIDGIVAEMREATKSTSFPSCFDSAESWQRTLDIGYDWVRLGAYLDADFPLSMIRDLLASSGQQPNLGASERPRAQAG